MRAHFLGILDLRNLPDPRAFSRPSTIRPPMSTALCVSAVLAENVHASQVEMPCGLQHVTVVGIDLLKPLLYGAGQMQRVTGSDEDSARKIEDGFAGPFEQVKSHAEPVPHPVLLIFFELFQDGSHLAASHMMLSDVAFENRCKLQPSQLTRRQAVRGVGNVAEAIRARLIEIALGDPTTYSTAKTQNAKDVRRCKTVA